MENKTCYISCPHCGYEYLPAEIYYPDSILGNPETIVRDEKGKIQFFTGETISMVEEFSCYHCGNKFVSSGHVQFTTEKMEKQLLNEEHKTIIYTNRVPLREN